MVLGLFFDISTSFRFSENQCECPVHSWSLSLLYHIRPTLHTVETYQTIFFIVYIICIYFRLSNINVRPWSDLHNSFFLLFLLLFLLFVCIFVCLKWMSDLTSFFLLFVCMYFRLSKMVRPTQWFFYCFVCMYFRLSKIMSDLPKVFFLLFCIYFCLSKIKVRPPKRFFFIVLYVYLSV